MKESKAKAENVFQAAHSYKDTWKSFAATSVPHGMKQNGSVIG